MYVFKMNHQFITNLVLLRFILLNEHFGLSSEELARHVNIVLNSPKTSGCLYNRVKVLVFIQTKLISRF